MSSDDGGVDNTQVLAVHQTLPNLEEMRQAWNVEFQVFKDNASKPVKLKDCLNAMEIMDRHVRKIGLRYTDVESLFAGATLLDKVLTDLSPWLSKTTSQYVYAVSELINLYTYSMRRERAVMWLNAGNMILKQLANEIVSELPPELQQSEFLLANIYIARARRNYFLHFGYDREALATAMQLSKLLANASDNTSFPDAVRHRHFQQFLSAHATSAGIMMTIMQTEHALRGISGDKSNFQEIVRVLNDHRNVMDEDFDFIMTLAKLNAYAGNIDKSKHLIAIGKKLLAEIENPNAHLLFMETRVCLLSKDDKNFDEAIEVLEGWKTVWDKGKSLDFISSLKDIDNLDTLTLLHVRNGNRARAEQVQREASKEKAKLRRLLIAYGTEEQKIRALLKLNELAFGVEFFENDLLADTVLNSKNAILASMLHPSAGFSNLSLQELQTSLGSTSIYFDYVDIEGIFTKTKKILCMKITKSDISFRWLDPYDEIASRIKFISSTVRSAYDVGQVDVDRLNTELAGFAEIVFGSNGLTDSEGVPYKNVFINPTGILQDVPWWTLPDHAGRPLVLSHEFSFVSSARSVLKHKEKYEYKTAIIIADPESETEYALPGARLESFLAQQALEEMGTTVESRFGNEATASNLRIPCDILHIACHAKERDEEFAFYNSPVLRLSTGQDDAVIEVAPKEIATHEIKRDLVVLSACFSQQGNPYIGEGGLVHEGRFGLNRAFLVSGADHIVSSIWQVSDRYAPEFFREFYTILSTHEPIAAFNEAIRRRWNAHDQKNIALFSCFYGGFAIQH